MQKERTLSMRLSVVTALVMFGCTGMADTDPRQAPGSQEVMPDSESAPAECDFCGPSMYDPSVSFPGVVTLPVLLARAQHAQALIVDKFGLFWTDYDPQTNIGSLMVVLRGEQIARTVVRQDLPMGLASDENSVFWADMAAGTIMKLDKATRTMSKLAIGQGSVFAVAVDASYVYFSNIDAGTISRVSKQGGAIKVLADTQDHPSAIAVVTNPVADISQVYWANLGSAGTLNTIAGDGGGTPRELVSGHNFSNGFVVDGDNIYWADPVSRSIKLYSLRFAKIDVLARDQHSVAGLATDHDKVYWTTQNNGAVNAMTKVDRNIKALCLGRDAPKHIVVNDDYVFWTDSDYGWVFSLKK